MRRQAAATLAVVLTLATPASALAAACPKTTLGEVEHEAMCLECGVPLDVAENSLQAKQERAFISRQIAACKTKDQIKDALAAQYGDRVLSTPKAEGFGLAAYLVPIGAVVLGGLVIFFGVRRWRGRRAQTPEPTAVPDPRESARLDADLGRYEL